MSTINGSNTGSSSTSSGLNGCLVSCNNNGKCMKTQNEMSCICNEYFSGASCNVDTRACSSYPCLNNATCYNKNATMFECICSSQYYGVNCENRINACENITCSSKGYCVQSQSGVTSCNCLIGYTGEKCDIEQTFKKIVTNVQITSLVILLFWLGSTCLLVILNDIWNCHVKRPIARNEKKDFLQRLSDQRNAKSRKKKLHVNHRIQF